VATRSKTSLIESINRINAADFFHQSPAGHCLSDKLDRGCLCLGLGNEVYDNGSNVPASAIRRQRPFVGIDVNQQLPKPMVLHCRDRHRFVVLYPGDLTRFDHHRWSHDRPFMTVCLRLSTWSKNISKTVSR
jgi:hypothetical protein